MNKILSYSDFKHLSENNPTEAENNLKLCEYEYNILGDYELFESTLNESINKALQERKNFQMLGRFLNRKPVQYNDDDLF